MHYASVKWICFLLFVVVGKGGDGRKVSLRRWKSPS